MKKYFILIALFLVAGFVIFIIIGNGSKHKYQIINIGETIVLYDPETGNIYYKDKDQWFRRGIDGKSVKTKELPK